jgi:hypothetical protein
MNRDGSMSCSSPTPDTDFLETHSGRPNSSKVGHRGGDSQPLGGSGMWEQEYTLQSDFHAETQRREPLKVSGIT